MTATAARALAERPPEAVASAVLEFLHGDLLRASRQVGHELQRELAGTWSARRGSYRILYEIHDDEESGGVILVVDIDHRRDIYRRRDRTPETLQAPRACCVTPARRSPRCPAPTVANLATDIRVNQLLDTQDLAAAVDVGR